MRTPALAVLLMLAATSRAEEPAKAAYPPDALLDRPAETLPEKRWRSDVVLGLPTALRVQYRLADYPAWLEGGIGIYTVVPSVFVGLRRDTALVEGRKHAFYFRPGIDFYYSPIYGSGGFLFNDFKGLYCLAADAEFLWSCRLGERFCGTLGTKLGLGGCYIGGNGFLPLPIVAFTFGLQY